MDLLIAFGVLAVLAYVLFKLGVGLSEVSASPRATARRDAVGHDRDYEGGPPNDGGSEWSEREGQNDSYGGGEGYDCGGSDGGGCDGGYDGGGA